MRACLLGHRLNLNNSHLSLFSVKGLDNNNNSKSSVCSFGGWCCCCWENEYVVNSTTVVRCLKNKTRKSTVIYYIYIEHPRYSIEEYRRIAPLSLLPRETNKRAALSVISNDCKFSSYSRERCREGRGRMKITIS